MKWFQRFKKQQPTPLPYYIPHHTRWPILGSLGLFCIAIGAVLLLHQFFSGIYILLAGGLIFITMIVGWFKTVIEESLQGLYNPQMDRTYRWGMFWFIVSETAFFGIFFMALFYVRFFIVPELGGQWGNLDTHLQLWPSFKAAWPLLLNPNPQLFKGPQQIITAMGIPAINTALLLSSAVSITIAHWYLKNNQRKLMIFFVSVTILLGVIFLTLQGHEYWLAYVEYGLTLHSGIYGSTFFILTGFHALHVTLGLMMLLVILFRCLKGHFLTENHFGFEAVSWYWHFVDVVWLFLFIFVYWL